MQKSESIQNLAKSLANFQSEIKNPTNTANNPFYKSKYAPLSDILNDVRPVLTKNGLSIIQAPSGDGENVVVTTLLMHESGEWLESDPLILKAEKLTAQGAGSVITYARRYSLSAVLGISSEDDDDGNNGEKPKDKPAQQPKQQATTAPKQTTQTTPKGNTPPKSTNAPQSGTGAPNWSAFWTFTKKDLKLSDKQIRDVAGDYLKVEVKSLTEVIKTQEELSKLTEHIKTLNKGA